MAEVPGVSFSPLGDPSKDAGGPTANQPVQEAIRTLSLRIPQIRGAAPSVAPNALMNAPGAAGFAPAQGGANLGGLEQILRKLFGMPATGAFAPPMGGPPSMAPSGGGASFGPSMSGGAAPMPSITPGYGENTPTPQPVDPSLLAPAPAPPAPPFVGGSSPLGSALGNKYGV